MQYTITINQRSVIENGWDLSFDDMAVFSFMKNFILEGALSKHVIHGKDYFWISFSKIREQLPMLSGNSDSSIRRHISNLVRVGLIEKCEDEISIKNRISLYRLGKSFPKYWHCNNPSKNDDTPPNLEGYPSKNERVTPPKMKGNNNTNILEYQDNNIFSPNGGLSASAFDSKESTKDESKPKSKAKPKPKKEPTLVTKAKNIFEPYFEKKTGEKYYWKAADGAQMKRLLSQLRFSRQNKGLSVEDEDLLSTLQIFLDKITDNWILSNLSVSNISSKYNELVSQARKNKSAIGIILRNNTDEKYLTQKIKQWK